MTHPIGDHDQYSTSPPGYHWQGLGREWLVCDHCGAWVDPTPRGRKCHDVHCHRGENQ